MDQGNYYYSDGQWGHNSSQNTPSHTYFSKKRKFKLLSDLFSIANYFDDDDNQVLQIERNTPFANIPGMCTFPSKPGETYYVGKGSIAPDAFIYKLTKLPGEAGTQLSIYTIQVDQIGDLSRPLYYLRIRWITRFLHRPGKSKWFTKWMNQIPLPSFLIYRRSINFFWYLQRQDA